LNGQGQRLVIMGPDGRGYDASRTKSRIQAPGRRVADQGKDMRIRSTPRGKPGCDQIPIRINGQGTDLIIIGPEGRGYDATRAKGHIQGSGRGVADQGKDILIAFIGIPRCDQIPIRINGQRIDLIIMGPEGRGYDTTQTKGCIQGPGCGVANQGKFILTQIAVKGSPACDQIPI